ncbi:MAG: multidrug effflux MFS transporter [Acidimicrobiales bacterium]|nr:multidrug effflux MFS transporter [Acidimicrobiales bacterium]
MTALDGGASDVDGRQKLPQNSREGEGGGSSLTNSLLRSHSGDGTSRRLLPPGNRFATASHVPAGWRLVVLVGSLSIFGPLCIDMYLPALPKMSRELHASASNMQLTLTSCLVGISLGQLLFGPISDRLGRRLPLLAGLAVFVASSIACAFAPNIYVLIGLRLLEGLGGAGGIVISRSIVRDLHSGVALVRFLSTLMLVTGLGPVLGPQIGSLTLAVTTWRGVFLVLAGFGSVLLVSAWWRVPETLPPDLRTAGRWGSTFAAMASVVRDRVFVGYALTCGLATGGAFAYVAGSSFVLQDVYRLSPGIYGLVFALNAVGLVLGAQINGRQAERYGPSRLLIAGLIAMVGAAALLLTVVVSGSLGLAGVIAALFVFMFGWGFVSPNAAGLALHRYPGAAGAAAAVIGAFQFVTGAVFAPLTGVGGTSDAVPMALLMLTMPVGALVGLSLLSRVNRAPAAATATT